MEKVQTITWRLERGEFIQGRINILTEVPNGVAYPDTATAIELVEALENYLKGFQQEHPELPTYIFKFEYQERKYGTAIYFQYNPEDVRVLTPRKNK